MSNDNSFPTFSIPRTNGVATRACCLGLLILSLGLGSLNAQADVYYRWVDDSGTAQYTAAPPKNRPFEKVTSTAPRTPSAAPSSRSEEDREDGEATDDTAEQQAVNTKDPERCAAARKRVDTLQRNGRIRMETEDGGFRYLSEEDIQEELAKSQEAVEQSC